MIYSIPGLEYSSVHSDVPTEALIGSEYREGMRNWHTLMRLPPHAHVKCFQLRCGCHGDGCEVGKEWLYGCQELVFCLLVPVTLSRPPLVLFAGDGNFWGISATAKRTDVYFVRADYSFDRKKSVWLKPESERIYWFSGKFCFSSHPLFPRFVGLTLDPTPPPDSGYASIVEEEEYMYLFFWEMPLEGDGGPVGGPVARVARVCKTDAGIDDSRLELNVFRSFVKVQLQCGSMSQSDTATSKVYPFIGELEGRHVRSDLNGWSVP